MADGIIWPSCNTRSLTSAAKRSAARIAADGDRDRGVAAGDSIATGILDSDLNERIDAHTRLRVARLSCECESGRGTDENIESSARSGSKACARGSESVG